MKTICFTVPLMEQCKFTITPEMSDISIQDALSFKETGADHSDYIKKVIEDGGDNIWLWCTVCVKATYKSFAATSYLGGCAYLDEADFIVGGQYEEMKQAAYEDIISEIESLQDQ